MKGKYENLHSKLSFLVTIHTILSKKCKKNKTENNNDPLGRPHIPTRSEDQMNYILKSGDLDA